MRPENENYKNLSCQYITEALFRLMKKKKFSDITISEITKEAGIARRTFYLNFSSKEDILDQHYEILIREYDEGVTPEILKDFRAQALYFFTFWKSHRNYALLLEKSGMSYMLMNRFHLYLDRTAINYYDSVASSEQIYADSYVAGGLWMILQTWLRGGFRETPEQLADIFERVASLRRTGS